MYKSFWLKSIPFFNRALIIGLLILSLVLSTLPVTYAQEKYAVITGVSMKSKIYVGETLTISISVRNDNAGLLGASLYVVIYIDGAYSGSTTSVYISRWIGSSYTFTYETSSLSKGSHSVTAYLFWNDSGTIRYQDSATSSVFVVILPVLDWSASPLTIQRGKTTSSSLIVQFKNGGNDAMYNVVVSVTDSKGLAISPSSQNIGILAAEKIATASFSITAPSSIAIGTYYPLFRISFNDFEGGTHYTPDNYVQIIVSKLSTSLTLSVPSSAKTTESISASATLVDGNENPVIGEKISFILTPADGGIGRNLGYSNTDSLGNAAITFYADPGTYYIIGTYSGSSIYSESTSPKKSLTVAKIKTTLIFSMPSAARVGDGVQLTVKMVDEDNKPIQGATVTFSIGSQEITAITDMSGNAVTTYIFQNAGTYTVTATYNGDSKYIGSTGTGSIIVSQFTLTIVTSIPNLQFIELGGSKYGTDASGKVIISASPGTYRLSVDKTVSISPGIRAIFDKWSDGTIDNARTVVMNQDQTFTAMFKTQFLLTVNSLYGTPKGSGWYDKDVDASFSVDEVIDHGNGTRHIFVRWTEDSLSTDPSTKIKIDKPCTVTAIYKQQYLLEISTEPLNITQITGGGWYDVGAIVSTGNAPPIINGTKGVRYLHVSWLVDEINKTGTSVVMAMNSYHKLIANYKIQYYLTLSSSYGTSEGEGWYDAGSVATFSVKPKEEFLIQHVFTNWIGSSTATTTSSSVTMDSPKDVVAVWRTDYIQLIVLVVIVVAVAGGSSLVLIRRRKGGKPLPSAEEVKPEVSTKAKLELERERITEMLKTFKEKYDKGEIDEKTYLKLKKKYENELKGLE